MIRFAPPVLNALPSSSRPASACEPSAPQVRGLLARAGARAQISLHAGRAQQHAQAVEQLSNALCSTLAATAAAAAAAAAAIRQPQLTLGLRPAVPQSRAVASVQFYVCSNSAR